VAKFMSNAICRLTVEDQQQVWNASKRPANCRLRHEKSYSIRCHSQDTTVWQTNITCVH